MIEQIETFKGNTLAIEVIGGFSETDEKLCQKFFQHKLDEGFEQVNILVKLDQLKISQSSTKAFMEDTIWALRNYPKIGHLAIVAHSGIVKAIVAIDSLFFQRASKGRYERYFDISQMDEAMEFVTSGT
jgi:hypothetical protein